MLRFKSLFSAFGSSSFSLSFAGFLRQICSFLSKFGESFSELFHTSWFADGAPTCCENILLNFEIKSFWLLSFSCWSIFLNRLGEFAFSALGDFDTFFICISFIDDCLTCGFDLTVLNVPPIRTLFDAFDNFR